VTTTASGGTITAGLASLAAGFAKLGWAEAGWAGGCCAKENPAAQTKPKYRDVLDNFIDVFIVAGFSVN